MEQIVKNKSLIVTYKNINNTIFFNKMDCVPFMKNQMYEFITYHLGAQLFLPKINLVCEHFEMKDWQLDVLFIFCRFCQIYSEKFQKDISKIMQDNITIFENIPKELLELLIKHNFIERVSEYISDFILLDNNIINTDTISEIFNDIFKDNLENMLKENNDIANNNFVIAITYFNQNKHMITKYAATINAAISTEMKKLVSTGNKLLDICILKEPSLQQELETIKMIYDNKNIVNFKDDDILKTYYEFLFDIKNENIVPSNNTNNANFVAEHNEKIQKLVAKIDAKAYIPTKNYFHGIMDCFIEHNFFKFPQDGAMIIYNTLLCERDTIGFTNKYDMINPVDHFTIIAIANDANTTFDQEMAYIMANKNTSHNFPSEIILRIFSRIFNVNITLYLYDLRAVKIDNTVNPAPQNICIYNTGLDYYNLYPKEKSFTPGGIMTTENYSDKIGIGVNSGHGFNRSTISEKYGKEIIEI